MRAGEVAKEAGVNVETLRYYERRGLLPEPSRRPSGYRDYAPDSVDLIHFIRHSQDLGFTLREIEELIELRHSRSRSGGEVRALAAAKLTDIETKIRRLGAMKLALEQLVESCRCNGPAWECPIIESLDDGSATKKAIIRGSNHGTTHD